MTEFVQGGYELPVIVAEARKEASGKLEECRRVQEASL
jgi:hypothetical protein